jgi:peptidyl-prolyl cis-trans isomerase SurA
MTGTPRAPKVYDASMLNRIASLLALAALLSPVAASAQADLQSRTVDRVVAVVGDSVILETEIFIQAQQMALADSTLPREGDPRYQALFRELLDTQVDFLLMLQAAEKDTLITVDDATIDQQIADYIDGLSRQFGGQPALQLALRNELGITIGEFRELRRSQARQQQMVQLYLARQAQSLRNIELTEDELLARFREVQPQMQQRPRSIGFRQVVIRPQASDSAKEAASAAIDSLQNRASAGEDFAELARQYSDDLGTASEGGDLGWFRRGQMVSEFEDVAFALGPQRMGVAESPFGFHLILVERTRGRSEVQARHILKIPGVSPTDIDAAREVARGVLVRARAGEDMKALSDELGDESEPDSVTVAMPEISQLPPSYAALRTASVGDVIGPLEYRGGAGTAADLRIAVVKIEEIREAGAYTFEDVRPLLAEQLQQMKKQERILSRQREDTYVDVRM